MGTTQNETAKFEPVARGECPACGLGPMPLYKANAATPRPMCFDCAFPDAGKSAGIKGVFDLIFGANEPAKIDDSNAYVEAENDE